MYQCRYKETEKLEKINVSLFEDEFVFDLSLQLDETSIEPIFSGGSWIGSRGK